MINGRNGRKAVTREKPTTVSRLDLRACEGTINPPITLYERQNSMSHGDSDLSFARPKSEPTRRIFATEISPTPISEITFCLTRASKFSTKRLSDR